MTKDKIHTRFFDFTAFKMVDSAHSWAELKEMSGDIIQKLTKATKRRSEYGNKVANKQQRIGGNGRMPADRGKIITSKYRGSMKGMRQIGYDELRLHKKKDDCWMVLNGVVYDFTEYAERHPGGAIIFDAAGKDGTALFSKLLDPI